MKGIFLDLETSGLDSRRHCVLEVAFKIVDLQTGEELAKFDAILKQDAEAWQQRDPESVRVNGFTWDLVEEGRPIKEVREEIISIFTDQEIQRGQAAFICQNPSFDRGFFVQLVDTYVQEKLLWPYHWLDFASMYWVLRLLEARDGRSIFPEHLQLSKDAIAAYFDLPTEEKPHRAMNGVDHLLLCYKEVVGLVPGSEIGRA